MPNLRKEFSKIYDQYIDRIYRFIFFKVNSQEVAEDLTSETFLKTWKVFQNGNPKIENIQAFLYQTAKNLVIDYYREKAKSQLVPLENSKIIDSQSNLEEKAILLSDFEQVKMALSQLNDDYQNVIIWRYVENFSISEIANLLNKTEGATRTLLHRALKTLREKLNSKLKTNSSGKTQIA